MEFRAQREVSAWNSNALTLERLKIQTLPGVDAQDLDTMCYRCSTSNPLVNAAVKDDKQKDCCVRCLHPFIRSFYGFETLPLVEFIPEVGCSEAMLLKFVNGEASPEATETFDQHLCGISFSNCVEYEPIGVTESVLKTMRAEELFVVRWKSKKLTTQYYVNVIPDVPVVLCSSCNTFFNEEDLDEVTLTNKGRCPFCKVVLEVT